MLPFTMFHISTVPNIHRGEIRFPCLCSLIFVELDTKNLSPFCKKLETYLKISGIPFEIVKGNHFFSSPTSKMPFIQYGDMIQDDSGLIISFLRGNLVDIDSDLTEEQHALSVAIQYGFTVSVFQIVLFLTFLT
jgi:hypothetical protein